MSTFSPDKGSLQARIRLERSCSSCRVRFGQIRHEIEWRRTRIDVYCVCGTLTSFTAPSLRNTFSLNGQPDTER